MYQKLGNSINAVIVFTILSILNTLRYPFLMLPLAVRSTGGALISIKRINDFLNQSDLSPLGITSSPPSSQTLFEIEKADFTWEGDAAPTLHSITMSLKRGEIMAVIGDVGAGKSSVIAALLGQIKKTSGDIKVFGSTAFVPQEAWLLNCSLRDNILFGSPWDAQRYKRVIKNCALERDLTLLIAGDRTEIGERGSNLSGGQKQRVSLAR